ncbi:hypothetical protein [Mariniblastus fucicola]|uniref:Uncharacterized protein n=1 Tax=Mariniblastus fucicola TaxID=980251 RepID=A0A5B9P936_9BACT|nr:hypothetical protein [Mariniblastus fucicola]QEG23257.1 hypothetical protein MFFC18_31530 [Mariniblastus fucicola]
MIQVALINRGWWFDSFLIRQIESTRGRQAARKALGFGGAAMILIGAWTMFGPWLKSGNGESSVPYPPTTELQNQQLAS